MLVTKVRPVLPALFVVMSAVAAQAQSRVTTPKEQFGHEIGAD